MKQTQYVKRYLCGITLEATTPIAAGSGTENILTDSLVALDYNGLPYIPATSIAGVVRHTLNGTDAKDLMGYQDEDKGQGSNVIFTEAKILDSKGIPVDGFALERKTKDPLLREYAQLPIRQHVRINERGTAEKGGKFDNQIVYAGSRFYFEVEILLTKEQNETSAQKILDIVQGKEFRLGGGTRNGYGKVTVVSMKKLFLNLETPAQLQLYLDKPSNLEQSLAWKKWEAETPQTKSGFGTKYELTLIPDNFFLFGSGMGNENVDMAPVKEKKVIWTGENGTLSDEMTLIPATSVKGALRHRTVYYYNKNLGRFADRWNGEVENLAEEADNVLFGYETADIQKPGVLFFDDVIEHNLGGKILNHVAIDRFTGGALEGALFDEEPLYGDQKKFSMEILLKGEVKPAYKEAFEMALRDLCQGLLPLGGGVNRGNGVFTGILRINGEEQTWE